MRGINHWAASKINTLATAGITVNVLALLGWLPPELENLLMMVGNILALGVIVVFRTWFTEK